MTGRLLRVRGLVQGVGFRPYVWRLANELGLAGWVKNDGAGVLAAVDGKNWQKFVERLPLELPPLARIDGIEVEPWEVETEGFAILDSDSGEVRTAIGPDAAICPDCIADLCDPAGRRWRYAFTTCTHCGPRFTVSAGIPYDRARTSLAGFPLCPTCAAEYVDPSDRRFHAETTCCPECGPSLWVAAPQGDFLRGAGDGKKGEKSPATDPIAEALARLRAGNIVAIKGLGGFHLACDARNPAAVAALRQRKQRDGKPFAVMALNAASVADFARIADAERTLLDSVAAPIVLCPKGGCELEGVAPGLGWLGVMRPATPLHLLLWHEAAGRPSGTAWLQQASDLLLVMTSANPHGEPLATGNDEALSRLGEIADAFLLHDRDIVVRCDDSVVRATPPGPAFLRRARGYTPLPVPLADDGPNVLALGGYLKNAICVTRGREAFLSQHIGGLDNAAAVGFLEETVAHLLAILDVKPDAIAHDLHPDFPSTALALRLAEEWDVPAIAVGHHHAHIAAICAEHGLNGIVGLALDGVGLGPDGGAWGGELLRVEGAACERLGHLMPLKLPGGDRAAREPWRMAVSALHGAGLAHRIGDWLQRTWPERDAGPLLTMLARDLRSPPTTSLGRWFDAVAGLLGVRDVLAFEGQAAMELEALAARHGAVEPAAYGLKDGMLDLSPLLPTLLDGRDAAAGSALFHATLAAGLAEWASAAVHGKKGQKIAIGGGCALNAVVTAALRERLAALGIELLEARQAPANDGGLALGQAWVARQALAGGLRATA